MLQLIKIFIEWKRWVKQTRRDDCSAYIAGAAVSGYFLMRLSNNFSTLLCTNFEQWKMHLLLYLLTMLPPRFEECFYVQS